MFDDSRNVYIVDGPLDLKLPPYALAFEQPDGFRLTGPFGHNKVFVFADVEKDMEREGAWLQLHTTAGLIRLRQLQPDDAELIQLGLTIPELHLQCVWGRL